MYISAATNTLSEQWAYLHIPVYLYIYAEDTPILISLEFICNRRVIWSCLDPSSRIEGLAGGGLWGESALSCRPGGQNPLLTPSASINIITKDLDFNSNTIQMNSNPPYAPNIITSPNPPLCLKLGSLLFILLLVHFPLFVQTKRLFPTSCSLYSFF